MSDSGRAARPGGWLRHGEAAWRVALGATVSAQSVSPTQSVSATESLGAIRSLGHLQPDIPVRGAIAAHPYGFLPATTAAVETPFDISASGTTTGSDSITISISHNVGTITIGGRQLNAVSYFEQPWPEISLIPYQSVAVDSTGIHVFWIYCAFTHSDVSGTFTEVFYESTVDAAVDHLFGWWL